MVTRDELCQYLDEYLQFEFFPRDISQNGLQVEGPDTINTIAVAVDARTQTLQAAANLGADWLLVHHGIFWGRSELVRGPHYRRLKICIENNLGLYAAHLPLDAHMDVGNNAVLGNKLGLENIQAWGKYKGQTLGVRGSLPKPIPLKDFLQTAKNVLEPEGGSVQHFGAGPDKVQHIGVITGDAANEIPNAASAGLDLLITGEPSHVFVVSADELGVHLVCGGHYATETFGVKALAEHLKDKFGIETHFIHHPTGA
ncbi:MAG: Nif3-like dinuclear metal center hexameric protein [Deltaproteobacteria bacterium]|nr:MAG: Nif3-like dinuclear metal center hexameric protein [Deltaproteobacteria bacterium]